MTVCMPENVHLCVCMYRVCGKHVFDFKSPGIGSILLYILEGIPFQLLAILIEVTVEHIVPFLIASLFLHSFLSLLSHFLFLFLYLSPLCFAVLLSFIVRAWYVLMAIPRMKI